MVVIDAIWHSPAFRGAVVTVLIVALRRRQVKGKTSYFCTHNVHIAAGACTRSKVPPVLSVHEENMMSALHQTSGGFPRYRSDHVDSSYEKETNLRANKLFLHSQRTYSCGACTCWKVLQKHSVHGENMMSALHQTPHGFPRYHRDRVDSSFEKETTLRENKLFLHSQRTYSCGGLHVLKGAPEALGT
jgi:hypothetical protein